MKKFIVKDSGKREEFSTGARRDIQAGKGRFDLIPTLPIRRLAMVFEAGAQKYGDDNYKKGIPLKRYLDSAERHLNNLKAGEPTEDHAIQAVWNLFSYVWTLNEIEYGRLPKELDNRPLPEPQYDPAILKIKQGCEDQVNLGNVSVPDEVFENVHERDKTNEEFFKALDRAEAKMIGRSLEELRGLTCKLKKNAKKTRRKSK